MPDISALFLKLLEEKGSLYVAGKLGHKTTSIVERWKKDGQVPESKKFIVFDMLESEGVL